MYTLKDLIEGKCAVINDGTLEELKTVLQAAFPNDTCKVEGIRLYYFMYPTYSSVLKLSNFWFSDDTTYLPTQSVKDFIKQIQPTMEKKIIGYNLTKPEYANASANIVGWNHPMYKLVKVTDQEYIEKLQKAGVLDLWFEPVYEQQFKVGDWVYIVSATEGAYGADGQVGTITNENANAGRSDMSNSIKVKIGNRIWAIGKIQEIELRKATPEEIEKACTKTFTMTCQGGTFELEVSSKGIYYRPEDNFLNANIRWSDYDIENSLPTNRSTYKMKVSKIDVGCKKDTLISEWIEVYNYYKSVKA